MTSFRDERFPDEIAEGATGGPEFATEVVTAGGGNESRNQRWALPKWKYNVATGIKDATDAQALFAFILAVAVGQAYAFPFKDWADYSATASLIGAGDGSQTVFNLVKTYAVGSYGFARRIKLPINSTVKMYLGGVLQSTGYTLSARGDSGGVVTFTSPPSIGVLVTASFEFDVPVRMDADFAPGNIFSAVTLLRFDNIGLVEVRSLA